MGATVRHVRVCPDCHLELGRELHCSNCLRPSVDVNRVRSVQADGLLGLTFREKFFLRRVVDRLGHGSIYLADNLDAGGETQVFVARSDVLTARTERRFFLACGAALQLDPKHAVLQVGFGKSEQGYVYRATALPGGQTLADRLAKKTLRPAAALRLAADLNVALMDAHQVRLTHGDVTPHNIRIVDRTRTILV
ncbi:MAG: hypothetical protein ACI9OJ_001844, partial [Myxococcota bacterium]